MAPIGVNHMQAQTRSHERQVRKTARKCIPSCDNLRRLSPQHKHLQSVLDTCNYVYHEGAATKLLRTRRFSISQSTNNQHRRGKLADSSYP